MTWLSEESYLPDGPPIMMSPMHVTNAAFTYLEEDSKCVQQRRLPVLWDCAKSHCSC